MAIKACGGGTPDLGFVLEVWGYIRGVGVRNKSGGPMRQPQGRGRALHPCGGLGTLLRYLFVLVFFIFSKNNLRKFSGQLDSV